MFCQQGEIEKAFVGEKYVISKSVFEELEQLEIKVPEQDQYYPYFSTFDFEAFTIPAEREYLGRQFHAAQAPATFLVCSSVQDHTEAVHVRTYRDSQVLVDQLIIELLKHQEKRKIIFTEKYTPYLDGLDHMKLI